MKKPLHSGWLGEGESPLEEQSNGGRDMKFYLESVALEEARICSDLWKTDVAVVAYKNGVFDIEKESNLRPWMNVTSWACYTD